MTPTDVAALSTLLHETAVRHEAFEEATPPHDWWHWYAPYLGARLEGRSPEEATAVADQYMREVHHVVRT